MSSRKATIYDLAKLADVSASTVSAVLSGNWRERRIADDDRAADQRARGAARVHGQPPGERAAHQPLRADRHDHPAPRQPLLQRHGAGVREAARASGTCTRSSSARCATPALELETVRTLISYRVESLLVAGATDPDAISGVCRSHGVAHVNVDLPGTQAMSVISDNFWGAQQLTEALIERSTTVRSRHAQPALLPRRPRRRTTRRAAASTASRTSCGGACTARPEPDRRLRLRGRPCRGRGRDAVPSLGGLPRALFVNSTIALEGVVRFLKTLPHAELAALLVRLLRLGPVRRHARLSAADGAPGHRRPARPRRSRSSTPARRTRRA